MALKTKKITQWMVYTGRPSWHQARAGHLHSGGMGFDTESEARAYAERFLKNHPSESVSIAHETITVRVME